MISHAPLPAESVVAESFTEDLLAQCGIATGMRVAVLGAGTGELAFLVAERVGLSGSVVAVDPDPARIASARRRAREQRFERLTLAVGDAVQCRPHAPFDAVIGRFYLMHQADPVGAIRRASRLLRPGGRLLFADWHLESLAWPHASAWPDQPAYRETAVHALETLKRGGTHVDMGLRLVNAFVEAGLPLPETRVELRPCGATREAAAVVAGIVRAAGRDAAGGAHMGAGSAGHVFLPLLAGAWTRVP
jgi:SAM-dependent methyltransferase